ncbi:Transposase (plasmid) [Mycetohabitans rhizoxinica HKI 454]|uniref:Transposase n=1 Tax=Mycetohabitans rhizoxinica (strain DSM 19002 / CIP 109453 / HKI 454) TaxID=882378 RepID=E5ATP0_MYCRK|nr:Transposase [Mycetohabitans rhizoxinica HKI 454]
MVRDEAYISWNRHCRERISDPLRDLASGATHGKVLKRAKRVPFFANWPASRVVMEACGSTHDWARLLTRLGHHVRLIAAQFVRPFVKSNKTLWSSPFLQH